MFSSLLSLFTRYYLSPPFHLHSSTQLALNLETPNNQGPADCNPAHLYGYSVYRFFLICRKEMLSNLGNGLNLYNSYLVLF